jgi:hypothetical protein
LIGPPLGRAKKGSVLDKKRQNEIDRIEVERKFSLAKGSFGLGLIITRLKSTSKTAIAQSILTMNVARILPLIRRILRRLAETLFDWQFTYQIKNMAFIL